MVTGVVIIGDFVVGKLTEKESEVVANIRINEGQSYANQASASLASSPIVRNRLRQGQSYFPAWRHNGPGGGILVGTPFSQSDAVIRLESGSDTFSRSTSHAQIVADLASFGSSAVHDYAHNTINQPNNRVPSRILCN